MSQKIAIHKGKRESLNFLWWRPYITWQKQMNDALSNTFPAFSLIPSSVQDKKGDLFEIMQVSINHVLSELYNNSQMLVPWWLGNRPEPYIDVIDNNDHFLVKADLPGVEMDSVEVSVSSDALTISGEKPADNKNNNGRYIRRECCSGCFSRTVALPENADLENARASFNPEGYILNIDIPKKEKSQHTTRRLEINAKEKRRSSKYSEESEKQAA